MLEYLEAKKWKNLSRGEAHVFGMEERLLT
jgi:hypothetical protein